MRLSRVACCFCLAVRWASAQTSADPVSAQLDEMISGALKRSGAPSVSVAVTREGKIVYAKAWGMADIAAGRAADATTRYAVGSISKQFTAAALLLMQQQGKLSLDDKVSKYFPELTRANEVSIRQLLSHTAGYEDFAPQDYIIPEWTHSTTTMAILDRWAKKPLNFDPGTRWQYSNTNYSIAGMIFERVSGRELVPFLRDTFFTPLGMQTAGDCETRNPADAVAYTRFALGPPRPVAREASGWYFAGGELCMIPSDLARWDIAFLQGKLVSPESFKEWTQEMKLADGKGTHYGLGLQLNDFNGEPVIVHSGEVSGFLATNGVVPGPKISVTILSNEDGINLIFPLARNILGALLSPSAKGSEAESEQVKTILGMLREGKIDRAAFTDNANSYFNEVALKDYQTSLQNLGKLKAVKQSDENLRGGMTHRTYDAEFEKQTVRLNVYVMPNGKIEQFLVEEQVK